MAAVPTTFRRAGGVVGPPVYTAMDDPRAMLLDLQRRYGKATPSEKTAADTSWMEPWNPAEPIENMFCKLEELFV